MDVLDSQQVEDSQVEKSIAAIICNGNPDKLHKIKRAAATTSKPNTEAQPGHQKGS
jgi:hypothetical protein